jgi:hypothetical protein
MTTPHQLCNLSTGKAVTSPIDGFPPRRSVGDPGGWSAPEGMAYLPIVAATAPPYDADTETLSTLPDAVIDGAFVTDRSEVVPKPSGGTLPQPLLTTLGAAFGNLPDAVQIAFAPSFAIVRSLIEGGRLDLAIAHVDGLEVPDDLAATKAAILTLLRGE